VVSSSEVLTHSSYKADYAARSDVQLNIMSAFGSESPASDALESRWTTGGTRHSCGVRTRKSCHQTSPINVHWRLKSISFKII